MKIGSKAFRLSRQRPSGLKSSQNRRSLMGKLKSFTTDYPFLELTKNLINDQSTQIS